MHQCSISTSNTAKNFLAGAQPLSIPYPSGHPLYTIACHPIANLAHSPPAGQFKHWSQLMPTDPCNAPLHCTQSWSPSVMNTWRLPIHCWQHMATDDVPRHIKTWSVNLQVASSHKIWSLPQMPVLVTTKRQRQLFYDHYTGKHVLASR